MEGNNKSIEKIKDLPETKQEMIARKVFTAFSEKPFLKMAFGEKNH